MTNPIIRADGTQEWYIDGRLHREDGPAWQSWNENGYLIVEEKWLNGVRNAEH